MIRTGLAIGLLAVLLAGGCFKAEVGNLPDVNVGGPPRQSLDSSQVPKTTTLPQCQDELNRAYTELQYRQDRIEKLQDKINRLERDKKELKNQVERLEKRLDKD